MRRGGARVGGFGGGSGQENLVHTRTARRLRRRNRLMPGAYPMARLRPCAVDCQNSQNPSRGLVCRECPDVRPYPMTRVRAFFARKPASANRPQLSRTTDRRPNNVVNVSQHLDPELSSDILLELSGQTPQSPPVDCATPIADLALNSPDRLV